MIPHPQNSPSPNTPINMPSPLPSSEPSSSNNNNNSSSPRSVPTPTPTSINSTAKAKVPLHILIVGCGLGGLSAAYTLGKTGHKITVVEGATAISEVGAGIQVGPNVSRLLTRWGLGEKLRKAGVVPEAITFRRYGDGERVGWARMGHGMEVNHGAPYYMVHRADLFQFLFDLAAPYMNLLLNRRVTKVDPYTPSVTLHTGEVLTADLIIGADGVKSTVRDTVVGARDAPEPTGDAAYRSIIPIEKMLEDEELRGLVDECEMSCWVGPGRHIMAYCLRNKTEYNLVMVYPDDSKLEESYTVEASLDEMKKNFVGWESRVQKLMNLVPRTLIWPLKDRKPLKSWMHEAGKVTLLGDACHPMLPYRAQGAAMSVEDSAVLANLLLHLSHPSQLSAFLLAYQTLRIPRTAMTQLDARALGVHHHLPDGPAQEARDRSMRESMEAALKEAAGDFEGNANVWVDRAKNKEQFDYDAEEAVRVWWEENGTRRAFAPVEPELKVRHRL